MQPSCPLCGLAFVIPLLVTDFVEGTGCPDTMVVGPAILTVLKITPGEHQRGGRHAIVRMLVLTPTGAQDDLHPLLATGVRAGRGRPGGIPQAPGSADRGGARVVPARDRAGLPHEGHLPVLQDRP